MVLFTQSLAVVTAILGALPSLAAPSLEKRGPVVGVSGGALPRPSLESVLADDAKRTCLLKVFRAIQAADGALSYDDIAGIHGLSIFPGRWQGDTIKQENNGVFGYCPHSSALFPTWHRPYLVLMEKALSDLAKKECDDASAASFRLPFWDWAASTSIPAIFMQSTVDIGTETGVANPLFNYKFPNKAPEGVHSPTVRGTTPGNPDRDREDRAQAAVQGLMSTPSIRSKVYRMLVDENIDYMAFSNKQIDDSRDDTNGPDYNSLETCHDFIHSTTGGTAGSMTFTTSSAFDPLFWFHHCNVDRYFAIWQALHGDTWIVANDQPGFTATSNLAPFPFNGNRYYNSNDVRDTSKLGYTYDTATGTAEEVLAKVNALYNDLGTGNGSSRRRSVPVRARGKDCDESKDNDHSSDYKPSSHQTGPSHSERPGKHYGHDHHRLSTWPIKTEWESHRHKVISDKNQYMSYTCNVKVHSEAYDGPFKVLVYIGDSCQKGGWKSDGGKFYEADDYVGYYTTFGVPKGQSMKMNTTYGGTVPLTNACINLVTQGKIPDMTEKTVSGYLKKHMCFKVVDNENKEIDAKDIKGLGMNVVSSQVTLPKVDTEAAKWGKGNSLYKVY